MLKLTGKYREYEQFLTNLDTIGKQIQRFSRPELKYTDKKLPVYNLADY